ncbi:MAG: hypothetical protein WCF94_01695 [bacterium]
MEILAMLLGGVSRVKMMRLFLFNNTGVFTLTDLNERLKIKPAEAKKELAQLEKMGLIKGKSVVKVIEKKKGKKIVSLKKKEIGFSLSDEFAYLSSLKNLLTGTQLYTNEEIVKRLANVGKLKMIIISGVFTQDFSSRVDLFVVGDHLKKNVLEKVIKTMEAEIGRELSYTYFETADFLYRTDVCDKLVYDVLDFPHETILDKLGEQKFRSK